jgi:hypothetical protein
MNPASSSFPYSHQDAKMFEEEKHPNERDSTMRKRSQIEREYAVQSQPMESLDGDNKTFPFKMNKHPRVLNSQSMSKISFSLINFKIEQNRKYNLRQK